MSSAVKSIIQSVLPSVTVDYLEKEERLSLYDAADGCRAGTLVHEGKAIRRDPAVDIVIVAAQDLSRCLVERVVECDSIMTVDIPGEGAGAVLVGRAREMTVRVWGRLAGDGV